VLCVEETIGVTDAAQIPRQRGNPLMDSAVRYAEERHWEVFPGTWLESVLGVQTCSCGRSDCAAPGAHPAGPDWATQATGSAAVARRMWSKQPTASILLPTGRTFDALEVSESAGFLALARMERMDLPPGPVTCTPDRRILFFVLPGAALKTDKLVTALGWAPATLDLIPRGEGHYVAAPPTRIGHSGAVQWACRPTPANRWLPDAEELIRPLAYACGQEAAAARGRRTGRSAR
jgi:bifunctional DNA primase/polymerase-like protein